jgi:uncharacterized membrane protein
MEAKAKFLGHAIHPILIVFPLGLFSTSVVFDILYLSTPNAAWSLVSFWMISAGLVGAAAAALFGLIDFLSIPSGTRAKSIGLTHGLVNLGVTILFGASLFLRMGSPQEPGIPAVTLSFIAVLLAMLGGWLGGELVERLGVGVHEIANLDAPNSLGDPVAGKRISKPRTV